MQDLVISAEISPAVQNLSLRASFASSRSYLQRPLQGDEKSFWNILHAVAVDMGEVSGSDDLILGPTGVTSTIDNNQVAKYGDLLEQLGLELLDAKPDDPLEFLIAALTFPFAVPTANPSALSSPSVSDVQSFRHLNRSRSSARFNNPADAPEVKAPPKFRKRSESFATFNSNRAKPSMQCPMCTHSPISKGFTLPDFAQFSQRDLGRNVCCTYEIRRPFFRNNEDSTDAIQHFLSSNDTIIVVVGDDNTSSSPQCMSPHTPPAARRSSCSTSASSSVARGSSQGGCNCSGAGKSKLCQWLDFPGRFIHGRKIIHVDSGSVSSFMQLLEREADATAVPSTPAECEVSRMSSSTTGSPQQRLLGGSPKFSPDDGSPNRWRAAEIRNLNVLEPSLTLIDSIEPPHFILDALHRHRYFRTEPAVRCPMCRSVSHNVALHKTIVFTRRSVFFKFPFPCRILSITRRPQGLHMEEVSLEDSRKSFNTSANPLITNEHAIVGDTGERSYRVSISLDAPPLSRHLKYRKSLTNESISELFGAFGNNSFFKCDGLPEGITYAKAMSAIVEELERQFSDRIFSVHRATLSLASSPTFKRMKLSRGRVEWDLANYLIEHDINPQFDLSEFPALSRYIVASPGSDVYVLRLVVDVKRSIRKGWSNKLKIGNLLCLAVASQHCLSQFHNSITAHDALQLYIGALLPQSRGSPAALQPPSTPQHTMSSSGKEQSLLASGMFSSEDIDEVALTCLDLQNIVLERMDLPPQGDGVMAPMVAHNLLDVRGADIPTALEDLLVQGVSVQRYQRQLRGASGPGNLSALTSFAFNDSHNDSVSSLSGLAPSLHTHHTHHPVRLSSDFTVVGELPYSGKADTGSPTPCPPLQRSKVKFCFLVHLDDEGCSAVLLIEANRVYACKSFSGTKDMVSTDMVDWTHRPFWSIEVSDRTVHFACLLSDTYPHHEQPPTDCSCLEEVLLLQLSDSSVMLFAINRIPRDAVVKVGSAPPSDLFPSRQMTLDVDDLRGSHMEGSPFGIPEVGDPLSPGSRSKVKFAFKAPESAPGSPTASSLEVKHLTLDSAEAFTAPDTQSIHRRRSQSSSAAFTAEEPLSPYISRYGEVEITVDYSLCPIRHGDGGKLGPEGVLLSSMSSSNLARSNNSVFGATLNLVKPVPAEQFLAVYPGVKFNAEPDSEPHLCAVSCRFIAVVADEDSDIITILRHGFLGTSKVVSNNSRRWMHRRKSSSVWSASTTSTSTDPMESKILQADEERITSMCIARDEFLIIGCENGMVQVFNIDQDVSLKVFHFHERAVRVVRPLVRYGQMAQHADPVAGLAAPTTISPVLGRSAVSLLTVCFITGSDDTTMSFFAIDDRQQLKSSRCHNAPLVDICTNSYLSRGIIVSADTSGAVVVSLVSPDNILGDMVTVWRNTTIGVRSIRLSPGSSWMLCTRDRQLPVAMPIAEWVRHGVGQFHIKPISVIHLTTCEHYLLTGGADGVIFVWDLLNQGRFHMAFRKHALDSTIVSISTSSDGERVVSSDSVKFVQLWQRSTGAVLSTLNHQAGQCFSKFLSGDFILVKRQSDLKVYGPSGMLVLRTDAVVGDNNTHSIDVYVATEDDCASVFAPDEIAFAGRRPTLVADTPPSSETLTPSSVEDSSPDSSSTSCSSDDDLEGAPTLKRDQGGSLQRSPVARRPALHKASATTNVGISDAHLRDRCFLGICNNTAGHVVDIYSFKDLTEPRYILKAGEIENLEDSSDDEELVFHEDTVQFFRFLPARAPQQEVVLPKWLSRRQSTAEPELDGGASGSTQALENTLNGVPSLDLEGPTSPIRGEGGGGRGEWERPTVTVPPKPPHEPSLFLALTGSDDLTVILWNWWRQEPLVRLGHSSFPTCATFWYPTAAASFHSTHRQCYNDAQLDFLWKHDASLQYEMDGPLCTFVTTQDTIDGVSMRVYEVRERKANYNQRCLMQRMGAVQSVRTFNTVPLIINEVGTAARSHERSVSTVCVRPSDGMLCTDTTSFPEVVFWRWMPEQPVVIPMTSEDSSDSEEADRMRRGGAKPKMALRPLRRISSRL